MSTFSVLVFDPVLPVNATRDDLIDRLQLPDSLLSSEHLTRGGPDETAEYDDRRLELIGAPPTTPNGSFLDGSKKPPDSLEQSFVTLLNAWTQDTYASTSGTTAPTGGDSPGEDSTPLHADRLTRLTASRADSEAAGTRTLFLERFLRQEESRFHSLGEFPIGGFLCVTFVATEADTATPFGAIVNIPSVGSNNPAFSFLDCHSCGRLRSGGRDRNPLSRAIAPGRVAFPLARRVPHRWIPVHHVCGHRSGYGGSFRSHCQHPSLDPCCCLVSRIFHSPPFSRPLLPSGFSSISQPPFSRPPAAI
jgi:hypothetical protein